METKRLAAKRDEVAPDGTDVRRLLRVGGGGLAHFELAAGQTSVAVVHRSVEEIWFFLRGRGEVWRRHGEREEIVEVAPDVCITIPIGTEFQFRSLGGEALSAVVATIPAWPGAGEASLVAGPWRSTVEPGPV